MIRRATPDDVEAIEAMDRICFPHDKPYIFGWDKNITWIAEDDVGDGFYRRWEPVGYLTAHPLKRGTWFFSRVGVLPIARGNGLQKKLMTVMEKHGRKTGWKEIVTYTAGFNGWSTRNILACGYRTYEPRKAYVGYDVVHMKKRLG